MTVYSPTWTTPAAATTDGPLFAGYFYDAETALYQVRHRYYHAELGAFVSRDPAGYRDSVNLYEYVHGNPTRFVDPSGLGFWGNYWYYLSNPSQMDDYAQEASDVIAGMGDSLGTTWGNVNYIDMDFERSRTVHHLAYTNLDFAESVGFQVHRAAIHGESAAVGAMGDLSNYYLVFVETATGTVTISTCSETPAASTILGKTGRALDDKADNVATALTRTERTVDPESVFDDFARVVDDAPRDVGRFPAEPDDLTRVLGVEPKASTTQHGTRRYLWEPNSNTRIRFESHPGDAGTFSSRHHGEHYHVEIKPSNVSWNQAKKKGLITKVKPEDYIPGQGTGYLPGEPFPGQ